MIYCPDTDTLNYLVKQNPPVVHRFDEIAALGHHFLLSPVVDYEITRYYKLKGAQRFERVYRDLTQEWVRSEIRALEWERASELWAQRHRMGRPIEDADLLIAVSALKHGAILVTNNTRHYEDLGLMLENWSSL